MKRRTFDTHAELWDKLDEHRRSGHDIYVLIHVRECTIDIEYKVLAHASD